jgi:hypothetical protein
VSLKPVLPQVLSWPTLNQSFALGPLREKKLDRRSYNDVILARTPKYRFRCAADAIPFNTEVSNNHRTFCNLTFCSSVKMLEACSFQKSGTSSGDISRSRPWSPRYRARVEDERTCLRTFHAHDRSVRSTS